MKTTESIYKTILQCRVCKSANIQEVLSLGSQFISSSLIRKNENNILANAKVPLTLMLCNNCSLTQLRETTNPELLFRNYFYRSAVNKTMRNNLRDVVKDVRKKAGFKKGDIVIDIGSNDGIMLSYFPETLFRIGVEPAKNIDWSNLPSSIKIVNDYFSKEKILKMTRGKKAKAVTAIAMFYDLDNPNKVAADIKSVLADDGIVCIQVSYLLDTIRDSNFFDICHEHLEYYTLRIIENLLISNGLQVFEATTNFTNGGSIRVFATHTENKIKQSGNIRKLLAKEEAMGLSRASTFKRLNTKITQLAAWVKKYLQAEIKQGGSIIGLGASTKGNVMLQVCGIDKTVIPYISDRNKNKIGLHTIGTDIEVISERQARKIHPSMMLVSPWYFRDEIMQREKTYLKKGGKLLFVMPYPHIRNKDGEIKLTA